jgi:hypothetical protein
VASGRANQVAQEMQVQGEQEQGSPLSCGVNASTIEFQSVLFTLQIFR